jgi:hypothetical protein
MGARFVQNTPFAVGNSGDDDGWVAGAGTPGVYSDVMLFISCQNKRSWSRFQAIPK